MMNIIRLYK